MVGDVERPEACWVMSNLSGLCPVRGLEPSYSEALLFARPPLTSRKHRLPQNLHRGSESQLLAGAARLGGAVSVPAHVALSMNLTACQEVSCQDEPSQFANISE